MDLVTNALLIGIATGITSGSAKVTESSITYAFTSLKNLLEKKLSKDHKVLKAISDLETNPNSPGKKMVLREEVVEAKLDQDQEVVVAAKELIELLKRSPGGQEIINQTVIGDKNIFSGSGDIFISNK